MLHVGNAGHRTVPSVYKFEIRRLSVSKIWLILCHVLSGLWQWPWPLNFWPLNGVTDRPCHGASLLPIFSLLGSSILDLWSGKGQTDRQRSSLHHAPPYGAGHKCNLWSIFRKAMQEDKEAWRESGQQVTKPTVQNYMLFLTKLYFIPKKEGKKERRTDRKTERVSSEV